MKTKGRKFCQKALSFVLALVMVVSVFTVAAPEGVQAAAAKSFKGSGKSTVTFQDMDTVNVAANAWKTNYIKFKANKTGYVTLTFKNASSVYNIAEGYVTLCNKNKKAIGPSREFWTTSMKKSYAYSRTYGVKKGQTYWFAVESHGGVKITASVTGVTKSSANSKGKAKNLAKNKAVKGVMIAGENKADWYKIKITGNCKKLTLTLTGKSQGDSDNCGIKMTFYDLDGKEVKTSREYYVSGQAPKDQLVFDYTDGSTSFSFPTGTYWVKVERLNSSSSGYYTLKWNY